MTPVQETSSEVQARTLAEWCRLRYAPDALKRWMLGIEHFVKDVGWAPSANHTLAKRNESARWNVRNFRWVLE